MWLKKSPPCDDHLFGMQFGLGINPALSWRPALDGLRAVAVLVVMVRHFESQPLLPGGILGVDVFFVLSGFLITTLLLQEWAGTGTISLRAFYIRRALRLLPALAALLFIYTLAAIFLRGAPFTGSQDPLRVLVSVGAAALYVFNWLRASDILPATGLTHLWSLAVEEQFYLVWPAVMLVMLRFRLSPVLTMTATCGVMLTSATMALWNPGLDNDRLYYGTDFRLQELAAGGLLAQLYVAGLVKPQLTQQPMFRLVLVLSLAFVAVLLFTLKAPADLPFHGTFLLVALAVAVIIAELVLNQRGLLARSLSGKVMVYLGKRSYALYLWHYLIGYWLRGFDTVPQVILAFALSIAAAEISFRLVEGPTLAWKSRLASRREARISTAAVVEASAA